MKLEATMKQYEETKLKLESLTTEYEQTREKSLSLESDLSISRSQTESIMEQLRTLGLKLAEAYSEKVRPLTCFLPFCR